VLAEQTAIVNHIAQLPTATYRKAIVPEQPLQTLSSPDMTRRPSAASPATRRLPRTVVVIGLVSLLNDFASEMVTPLIPLLLATVLGAGPMVLGFIEGLADTTTNLLKLWAGRRSDMARRRRKPFVLLGYALSNLVRPLIGLSGSWFMVLGIRVTDRIGKGLRSAPRDAMLADLIPEGMAARAYGLTRALDHAGAVLGALAAAAVVYWGTARLDLVVAFSAIPGLFAILLIVFGIREPARHAASLEPLAPLRWQGLSAKTRAYLVAIGLFALGRIPETFLLLRGHELDMSVVSLLLLWAAMHTVKVLTAEGAGRLADRIGRRPVLLAGYSVYVLALAGLAVSISVSHLWLLSLVLGLHFGLTEGAERALVRDLAPNTERGTAFGWFYMLVGLAAIPAGLLLGGVWTLWSAKAAFLVSAAITTTAALFFWWRVRT
jgi:MFS family permease